VVGLSESTCGTQGVKGDGRGKGKGKGKGNGNGKGGRSTLAAGVMKLFGSAKLHLSPGN